MFVPKVQHFSISLLVCVFNRHRQTWYQKFILTNPSLPFVRNRVKPGYYENSTTL